jgi:hypothetical protein
MSNAAASRGGGGGGGGGSSDTSLKCVVFSQKQYKYRMSDPTARNSMINVDLRGLIERGARV